MLAQITRQRSTNKNIFHIINSENTFSDLNLHNKKYLSERTIVRELKRGEYLWKRQAASEFCACILEGMIEIVNTNKNGEERIIGIFGPGDIIGLSAILNKINYPAFALIASKTCKVLKHYIRSSDQELDNNNYENMLSWQRKKLFLHEEILREKIFVLGAGQVHQRLIELFEHLINRFSKIDISSKNILIPISLTKTQIAKIVEARVETVIRTLSKWEKLGHISINSENICITNLEILRESDTCH
jgi:CRP-like cAMP-binding protein